MTAVREIEFADLAAVGAMMERVGWGRPVEADWQRLWLDNPASKPGNPRSCRGWVLEEAGRVLGSLYNFEQEYHLGQRTIRAAIAGTLVVDPQARGQSMQLVAAYARQPHMDLLLNTTASDRASKIFEFLKFKRIPVPHYDESLYWVLRPATFLNAAFRKKGWSPSTSRVASAAAAPLLWAGIRIQGRRPRFRREDLRVEIKGADTIDDGFDELWRTRISENRKLLADRAARTLRWHYRRTRAGNPPFFVCAYLGSRLVGFLVIVRQDAAHIGLRRALVADIFVEGDDADTTRHLLDAGCEEASIRGADMVEMIGFSLHTRRLAEAYRPFRLKNPAWPFLYKTADPTLQSALADPDVWQACLFDGDGSS